MEKASLHSANVACFQCWHGTWHGMKEALHERTYHHKEPSMKQTQPSKIAQHPSVKCRGIKLGRGTLCTRVISIENMIFQKAHFKASMSKKHLHIKQFCILVPLGNDVYSLFKSSIPKKIERCILNTIFLMSILLFIFLVPGVIFLR